MIRATITKDVWLLLRDRGALISLFALPVIFMLAFGAMFSSGPSRSEPTIIAVWTASGDARGAAIVEALSSTPGLAPRPCETADHVRERVASGQAAAGLVITATVEIVIDLGAPEQIRGPLQGALAGLVVRALAPPSAIPPIEVRSPPGLAAPRDRVSSLQVSVPGNAVLFGFFIAMTVAMTFAAERRSGTWRRLLASPVPRWKALLSTLVPYFLIGLGQQAFLFGIGALVFGMTVAGSLVALCALVIATTTCAMCLGLLFAALGGSEKQIAGLGSVVLLVMGMLGGCMMPRLIMPQFMQDLGLAVPHAWALDGYYAVLVRDGTTLADVAPSVGMLFVFAAAFAGIGLARFRFER